MGDALQRGEAAQDVGSRRTGSASGRTSGFDLRAPTSIAGGHNRALEVSVGWTTSRVLARAGRPLIVMELKERLQAATICAPQMAVI